MSLNVSSHVNGWPMYSPRTLSGFEIPGVVTLGTIRWYGLSAVDFLELAITYTAKPVTKYGRAWALKTTCDYIDDCSHCEVTLTVSNSVDGLVLIGQTIHTVPNQSWGWFSVCDLSMCPQPAKFRPQGVHITDTPDLPSWHEWDTQFPGMKPWTPPEP